MYVYQDRVWLGIFCSVLPGNINLYNNLMNDVRA